MVEKKRCLGYNLQVNVGFCMRKRFTFTQIEKERGNYNEF